MGCGQADCRLDTRERVLQGGLIFHACPACKALRSPDDAIERREVEPDATAKTPLSMRLLFRLRALWLGLAVPEFKNKQARILDCGCGDGQWLEWLKDQGYAQTMGMETNPNRLARVHERGVQGYLSVPEAVAATPDGQFDVIYLWHVLEHVDHPVAVLSELTKLLSPQGVLVVSLPNHKSLQTRLFDRRSAFVSYGHHVWFLDHGYFTWLKSVLPGFRIEPVLDLNLEYEAFGWVDTLVSAALAQDNILHATLKKGVVSGPLKKKVLALAALSLPLAGLLSLVSLALPRLGSTLTYCFRPDCDRVRPDLGGPTTVCTSNELKSL
jgi:2-polyprenyl-3-methyl-5-hydroxy-6-metoxy-1,4-benzoquinol methylase